MPAPENIPSAVNSSRKEKKKQAKEERDRLKQVEKKKRRLEKALATAAAIRIELEKKKQRRKEEEQRLDEEGAALAEAVALQVLVGEDADSCEESIDVSSDEKTGQSAESRWDVSIKTSSPCNSVEQVLHGNGHGVHSSASSISVRNIVNHGADKDVNQCAGKDDYLGYESKSNKGKKTSPNGSSEEYNNNNNKDLIKDHFVFNAVDVMKDKYVQDASTCLNGYKISKRDIYQDFQIQRAQSQILDWEALGNPKETLMASTERAKAAEAAAGMAAAQAVAALRIAEEARAEAEAAKKAAEAAISQVLDRTKLSNVDTTHQVVAQPMAIEMERDELKARLEETERQLKERTMQVVHLEQSLDDMTQYLLNLKAKLPLPSARLTKEVKEVSFEKEGENSERGSTNITGSSGGIDQ